MAMPSTSLRGIRILCVDDSLDCLEVLRTIFVRHGANVTACNSAEKAIVFLKNERFDVMVSDLSMPPGLDGYDLVHALRKMEDQDLTRQTTPTVAVSGDALRSSRKRRFADFQVYMSKPIDGERLIHVITRLQEADGEAVRLGSLRSWEAAVAAKAAVKEANDAAQVD
jgi:two-component system CheB/CheR fusion protein